MIDWYNLFANALWIIALAVALATLSYASWEASLLHEKLRLRLRQAKYQIALDLLDSVGPLSNIGLYATDSEDTPFLFAVANFPLIVKTDAERRSIFIQVNY